MPYYHCRKCMHEFEYIPDIDYEVKEDWSIAIYEKKNKPKCDWCGADNPTILEEKIPLERMCEDDNIEKLLKELVAYDETKKGGNSR